MGAAQRFPIGAYGVPTRYREVVLTVPKHIFLILTVKPCYWFLLVNLVMDLRGCIQILVDRVSLFCHKVAVVSSSSKISPN